MASFQDQCKERLKIAFDLVRAVSECPSFILVVDQYALKVLSHTVKMMQLINYGVASVQRLQLKRKKFKKIQALYLISPDSYELLLEDFPPEKPQYHSIHILMLTTTPTYVLKAMGQCTMMAKRVKSLYQINLDLILHSKNEVLIASRCANSFSKALKPDSSEEFQDCLQYTITELSTVLLSMNSFYIVEILYNKSNINNFSEKVALGLKEKLQTSFKTFEKNGVQNYTNSAPLTTFLILDRYFDAVSPLIRDFHYLSILYDQKGITEHKYQLKTKKQSKVHNLDQNDELFEKYKYCHLAVLMNDINKDFEKFSHVASKIEKEQQEHDDMQKLAEIIKHMPQIAEMKQKYSLHLNSISQILQTFKRCNYRQQGELQQMMVSMITAQGKKVKDKDVFSKLMDFLQRSKNEIENIKLVLIALMTMELKHKQRNMLLQILDNNSKYQGIQNRVTALCGVNTYRLNIRKSIKEQTLILDRHQPKIEQLMREILNGGRGDLKFLRVGSDSRANKTVKSTMNGSTNFGRKKIGMNQSKENKPRLIVFMGSAIGYNQMRCISQFDQHYHVIFASHNFVTQTQYLNWINQVQANL